MSYVQEEGEGEIPLAPISCGFKGSVQELCFEV